MELSRIINKMNHCFNGCSVDERDRRGELKYFEKVYHIPKNLRGHVHAKDCAHAQKRPKKVL